MGLDNLVSLYSELVDEFDLDPVNERADPVFWVSEFFKREEIYLAKRRLRYPFDRPSKYPFRRPQGSMRKKASIRMGARGERFRIAYAGWNQKISPLQDPSLGPASLKAIGDVFPEPEMRVVRYERLSVLSNRALYAASEYALNPLAFVYGFDGSLHRFDMRSITSQLRWDLLEDDLPVPETFAQPFLLDEPVESRPEREFKL